MSASNIYELGPTGLAMLKTLKEDGFSATLYERRSQVGGLWAYTENTAWTTALKCKFHRRNVRFVTWNFSTNQNNPFSYASEYQQVHVRLLRFSNAR